jgi:hypothetical protein
VEKCFEISNATLSGAKDRVPTMTEGFLEFLVRVARAIRDALRSRYVRQLETEVARLRAENRALLNSLLGTAGIPPIFDPERQASAEAGRAAPVVRRRSWQQLGRMLEIEEARRLRQLQQQTAEAEPRSVAKPSPAKPNGGA